jgi:hypothetical protein
MVDIINYVDKLDENSDELKRIYINKKEENYNNLNIN